MKVPECGNGHHIHPTLTNFNRFNANFKVSLVLTIKKNLYLHVFFNFPFLYWEQKTKVLYWIVLYHFFSSHKLIPSNLLLLRNCFRYNEPPDFKLIYLLR